MYVVTGATGHRSTKCCKKAVSFDMDISGNKCFFAKGTASLAARLSGLRTRDEGDAGSNRFSSASIRPGPVT